jgi:hypothetical protein
MSARSKTSGRIAVIITKSISSKEMIVYLENNTKFREDILANRIEEIVSVSGVFTRHVVW